MSKLRIHGEPVADYVRRSTNPGEHCEITYRLISDVRRDGTATFDNPARPLVRQRTDITTISH